MSIQGHVGALVLINISIARDVCTHFTCVCFHHSPNFEASINAGAGFVALLRGAGERERTARQEAHHWQTQAAEWKEK